MGPRLDEDCWGGMEAEEAAHPGRGPLMTDGLSKGLKTIVGGLIIEINGSTAFLYNFEFAQH
jgi:hypothetical protein